MSNLYAVIAFISGLFVLGHQRVQTTVIGMTFSCTILEVVALIVALLALVAIVWLLRGAVRGVLRYAS